MKKQAFILLIIVTLLFMSMACVGSEEVNRASTRQNSSSAATATSAALEFHVQLTLTASEAAAAQGNSAQSP
jgi:uncharacterized membrane protein